MQFNDRNKLNRIEELKGKLFSRDYEAKTEHRELFAHRRAGDVSESWVAKEEDDASISFWEKFFMKTSFFKKFFLFSIIFFVLASGYAFYIFFIQGNTVSNDNIDITVIGNTYTAGGEELPLQVEITNKNNSPLELVDLVLEYPKSSSNVSSQDVERIRQSIGTIPAGAVKDENVKVVLFGEQGSIRPVKVSIEYRVEKSNAIFIKDKIYNVSINSTPINLSVDVPSTASPNQEINLNVKAVLNSTKSSPTILIKIDYPIGFAFESATPAPSFGNNVWNLGGLVPGAEKGISVKGKMIDVFDGEEKVFHVWSGSQSYGDKSVIETVFNSMAQTVSIKKPSVEANLFVNGVYQREYAVDTETAVSGEIRWVNNLDTKITDLRITAEISGNAFDQKTISAHSGFFDSSSNAITWDKNSQKEFGSVNPGDSGSVTFSVSPLSLFSDLKGLLSNPLINIEVNISGKQDLTGYALTQLANSSQTIVRVISDVGFNAKGLYYSGAFTNKGPIPPKVEQLTTYTIVWSLSNTANNISQAVVHSSIPSWVTFVGPLSPPNEDLVYNPSTREITWNIGGISKGTGLTVGAREVSFQVAITPSLSQVDTNPVLVKDAVLTGHDDFANVSVQVNKAPITTRISSDPLFPQNGDRVTE